MGNREFIVSKTGRMAAERAIVDDCLLRLKTVGVVWTIASLGDAAWIKGVDWTDEQLEAEVKRLLEEGIIEEVKDMEPEPVTPTLADAVVVSPSTFD